MALPPKIDSDVEPSELTKIVGGKFDPKTGLFNEGVYLLDLDLDNAVWRIDLRVHNRNKYNLTTAEKEMAAKRNVPIKYRERRLKENANSSSNIILSQEELDQEVEAYYASKIAEYLEAIITEGFSVHRPEFDNLIIGIGLVLAQKGPEMFQPGTPQNSEVNNHVQHSIPAIQSYIAKHLPDLESEVQTCLQTLNSYQSYRSYYQDYILSSRKLYEEANKKKKDFEDSQLQAKKSFEEMLKCPGELENSCGFTYRLSGTYNLSGEGNLKVGSVDIMLGKNNFKVPTLQVEEIITIEVDMRPKRKVAYFVPNGKEVPFFISNLPGDARLAFTLLHQELQLVSLKKLTSPSVEVDFGWEPRPFC